jgi:predicted glycosyltransferase
MDQTLPVSVLLAPLDWGLGHATRCIPIIKELNQQGARVWVAASGPQESLLRQEFPLLDFLTLPGQPVRYKSGKLLKWGLILKIPSLLRQIRKEHQWLGQCLKSYPIDAVISDSRYGLYHEYLPCILITHQLNIQSGFQNTGKTSGIRESIGRSIDKKIMQFHYRFISRFSACWVPDEEMPFSLAGALSNPPLPPPVPVRYIGLLSRFTWTPAIVNKNSLLILLSGPEPQRTQFEQIIMSQLKDIHLKTVLIRGLPGDTEDNIQIDGVEIYNHLDSASLSRLMASTEFIVARSGYSTIMDLVRLQRHAILIPTPGQTEQEYLGRYLHEKKWMYTVTQEKLKLKNSLEAFGKIRFSSPQIHPALLTGQIRELMRDCIKEKEK